MEPGHLSLHTLSSGPSSAVPGKPSSSEIEQLVLEPGESGVNRDSL